MVMASCVIVKYIVQFSVLSSLVASVFWSIKHDWGDVRENFIPNTCLHSFLPSTELVALAEIWLGPKSKSL